MAAVTSGTAPDETISILLRSDPGPPELKSFGEEQKRDPGVMEVIKFLETGQLPVDQKRARRIATQQSLFTLVDGVLYFLDPKQEHRCRAVVPSHLQEQILEENHRKWMGGHFSGKRMYSMLARRWWWDGMYASTLKYARNCPECAIVTGGGKAHRPPLHPIPVKRPFQIVGVDIMDLPLTTAGNKHVIVFQDYFTKWPIVCPLPDQKAHRIARVLVDEVIPLFGMPEALLSDRGTNLLSHLMKDLCELLGIKKLNTTAYHPECDGMVERFNRTLKTMLRKHASRFGNQWDRYLSGVVWAYRNVPHESTGEKPSFLMFGVDLRTPTEAALLPPTPLESGDIDDYREEVVLSLSSARKLAADSIQRAQQKYRIAYDRKAKERDYRVGDWVLVRFPQEEKGKLKKLSRPWHGPYRVVSRSDPDLTVSKVYYPQEGEIQVHQTRISPCPPHFPAGYFWYGSRRHSPGRPPKWVQNLLQSSEELVEPDMESSPEESDQEDNSSTQDNSVTETNLAESDPESDTDSNAGVETPELPERTSGGRYSLRHRTKAPDRLMHLRSGRAPLKEGVM